MISKDDIIKWAKDVTPTVELTQKGSHYSLNDPSTIFLDRLPNLDKKDNQLFAALHGAGPKQAYGLYNNDMSESVNEIGPFTYPHGEKMPKILDYLKDQNIDKVHSLACNPDHGGNPEFYEQILGKNLKEVIMNPAGTLGAVGGQTTNLHIPALNKLLEMGGITHVKGSPQHIYQKEEHWMPFGIGDKWVDKGEHVTSFDKFMGDAMPYAGAASLAGIAYALWKRKQNQGRRRQLKDQVVNGR